MSNLQHKKILITAPDNYAKKLIKLLKKQQASVYHFPAVQTFIHPDLTALQSAIRQIDQYALVILPSRMAIDAFFETYREIPVKSHLDKTGFLAIGKDQDYLSDKYGINVTGQPKETGTKGLVDFFKSHPEFSGKKILVIVPEVIGIPEPDIIPDLINDLSKTGVLPDKIAGYITKANRLKNYPEIAELIVSKDIDMIAFTSTAEILALLKNVHLKDLKSVKTACFGPYTGKNAIKSGLNPVYIGQKYASFEDFVNGINSFFSK